MTRLSNLVTSPNMLIMDLKKVKDDYFQFSSSCNGRITLDYNGERRRENTNNMRKNELV